MKKTKMESGDHVEKDRDLSDYSVLREVANLQAHPGLVSQDIQPIRAKGAIQHALQLPVFPPNCSSRRKQPRLLDVQFDPVQFNEIR